MAKAAKRKVPATLVVLEPACVLEVWFTGEFSELETLRPLAHLVVDILADSARQEALADTLASDLASIAEFLVLKNIADLVQEAGAEAREARRT